MYKFVAYNWIRKKRIYKKIKNVRKIKEHRKEQLQTIEDNGIFKKKE
jgi:hypothetical protein